MNEIVTSSAADSTDLTLAAVPNFDGKAYAVAVFEPFKKQITKAKREAAKVEEYDITTGAGMGRAKELRAMFRDIRTAVENVRKERKAPIIDAGKLLDARAAEIKAEVEPFEDKYDAEIKAEEARKEAEKQAKIAAERARVEAIENRIAQIRGAASRLASADSSAIKAELNTWTLLRLDPADYQEYLEDALTAVNTTIDQLTNLLATAEAREAEARRVAEERAELARLKEEQAERERMAAEEKRKAAEAAAESARQLAFVQAQQAKQQQVMQAVMGIQNRANFDGSASELLGAIKAAENLETGEDLYGDMAGMAQMAKTMTINTLRQKYEAKLVAEPQPETKAAPAEELVQVPVVEEGAPVEMGVDLAAPGGDQSVKVEVAPVLPIPLPKRPDDAAIIDVVAKHFDVSAETAINWLACINFAAAYASLPVTA
jgi:hypothetical protein